MGREGVWGLEDSHPARPLLTGVVVFWLVGWLGKLGVRRGKGHPGTRERSLVRGQELVASWGVEGVIGMGLCRSGLHPCSSTGGNRADGNQVARLATVATQPSLRSATTLFEGEWASCTSSGIQIHRNMLGGGRWLREAWGGKGWLLEGREGGTGRDLVAGEDCSSVILLDVDGCSHVV